MFGRRSIRNAVLDAGQNGIKIDGPTAVNVTYVGLQVAAHASLVQQMQQQPRQHQEMVAGDEVIAHRWKQAHMDRLEGV
jgi:hypothetical protein